MATKVTTDANDMIAPGCPHCSMMRKQIGAAEEKAKGMSAVINHRGLMLKQSHDRATNLASALVESEDKRKVLERTAEKEADERDKEHLRRLEKGLEDIDLHQQFWDDYTVLLKNMAVGQKDVFFRIRQYVEKLEREA